MKKCILVFLSILLFSCSKEVDYVPAKDYLLNAGQDKSWMVTSLIINGQEQLNALYPSECQRDELLTLRPNDSYLVNAQSNCDSLLPVLSGQGLWYVSETNDEFILMNAAGAVTMEATLQAVSSSSFILQDFTETGEVREYHFESVQ